MKILTEKEKDELKWLTTSLSKSNIYHECEILLIDKYLKIKDSKVLRERKKRALAKRAERDAFVIWAYENITENPERVIHDKDAEVRRYTIVVE